ncbi:MAG: hypothetical protein JO023_06080 [Chloroflexi bacterium]|nr:hypothetical protein [Chloroflexota bacterium]
MSGPRFRCLPVATLLPPLVGAAAVALVLGCQAAAPAPTPTPPSAAVAAQTVEIDATDYAFNAPETLPAGLTTIRLVNHGQEPHHGQLLRLNDGVTFEQFTATLQQEGEGALRLTSGEGGPGAVDPHGSSEVTVDLKPGTYALVCFIAGPDGVPHLMKGMLKPIQVTQLGTPAQAPIVAGTFMMKDFSFDMPSVLPVGAATYKVVNHGPQMHELNIVKLHAGKTAEDALAWEKAPGGPPPFDLAGGINAFSADGSGYMTLDLQPGTYLAVCNVPDPTSGLPHSHLGMVKQFNVQG